MISPIVQIIFMAASAATPPKITGTTGGGTYEYGGSATLTVTASSYYPLSYQWSKNGSVVPGATSQTHTFSVYEDATYTCEVANPWGGVSSSGISVSVSYPPPVEPSVYITGGGTYPWANPVTLTAHVSGDGPFTYFWTGDTDPSGSSKTFASIGPASTVLEVHVITPYGEAWASESVTWV